MENKENEELNKLYEEQENSIEILGETFNKDFDDAKVGPALCDVAIALTNLFISRKNGTDINGMNIFLDAYYKNNIEQRQVEEPIIKNIATEWLKYTLKNPKLDKKTIDGLENKLLWIEKIF